jgi:hypothetical protein
MSTVATTPRSASATHETVSFPWRRFVRNLASRQPRLAAAAELFLLAMIPVALALVLDDRQVNDVDIWLKPLKFLMSLSIYYATLAWFHGYLPEAVRVRRLGRVIVGLPIVVGLLEMTWLLGTAAVGQPSHFNFSAPIYAISYGLAGLGATMLMATALVTGILIGRAREPELPSSFRLSIVLGCSLAFAATMVTAGFLASGNGHWVGGPHSDAGGLPLMGWSRTSGDLRVAHFFALHALQVVPFMGWIVTRAGVRRAKAAVVALAALYAGWISFTFLQALSGHPLI